MRITLIIILLCIFKLTFAQGSTPSITDSLPSTRTNPITNSDTDSLCSIIFCTIGIASYYGRQFQNRFTSSGERFDMYKYTAAHKTLPFGTQVIVTNLINCKSVVVKINDRMPSWNTREIDLSYIAAKDLNYIAAGVTKVQLEIFK